MPSAAFQFGRNILGPILYSYSFRLYLYQKAFADRDAVSLYITRGGLRMKYLFDIFLHRRNLQEPVPSEILFSSRVAAAKGCLTAHFEPVHKILASPFYWETMGRLVTCLFPQDPSDPLCVRPEDLPSDIVNVRGTWAQFTETYNSQTPIGGKFRGYFAQQETLMDEHLKSIMGDHHNILLVDTGWEGTIQSMLMRHYPDREFLGLYFARWNRSKGWLPHLHAVMGLTLDNVEPHKHPDIQTLFEYHHLIESPLEPDFTSVSGYKRDAVTGRAVADIIELYDPKLIPPQPDEDVYAGIVDYFNTVDTTLSLHQVMRNLYCTTRKLKRLIRYPSCADVEAMNLPPRSADFGFKHRVPILSTANDNDTLKEKLQRVQHALWKQGQITRCFPILHHLINFMYNQSKLGTGLGKLYTKWVEKIMTAAP